MEIRMAKLKAKLMVKPMRLEIVRETHLARLRAILKERVKEIQKHLVIDWVRQKEIRREKH